MKKYGIDTIHPGYGFLSESAEFAQRLWQEANCIVIGPGKDVLSRTGDKLKARGLAQACDVPVLPATTKPTSDVSEVVAFAKKVGFPVIVKAVDGGGGRGIRIIREEESLQNLTERAMRESPSGQVFVEKAAINGYRHVEVQIVGDAYGNVRHLWERECSIQRRFQKVVEFAPSSIKDRRLIARVIQAAERMAREVGYMSLGTFEFLVHESSGEFFFLEVNPRIQVEHTVTESICLGIDLVKIQLQIASGKRLDELLYLCKDPQTPPPIHSIQLRVTAEDASRDWGLSVGKISSIQLPSGNGVRVDTHMLSSPPTIVSTDFDSLLAKIIITAPTWEDAVVKARRALNDTRIEGVKTSLDALRGILSSEDFLRGKCDTRWLEGNLPSVMKSGMEITTVLSNRSFAKHAKTTTSSTPTTDSTSQILLRKGDAWTLSISPTTTTTNNASQNSFTSGPSHIQLQSIKANNLPTQLSCTALLTTPSSKAPQPITIDLHSTTASSSSITSLSKHRRGDLNNANHVIIPFPGELMELLVDVGDVLDKGAVVAVVRQMKMELEVRTNKGGVVEWVGEMQEGEDVGEGVLVCVLGDAQGKARL